MEDVNQAVLEEILLGYLRSSKKIELANIEESEGSMDTSTIRVTFDVKKDFAKTLMHGLDTIPETFFKKNQKNEY